MKKALSTIIFTVSITFIFIAGLAFLNEITQEPIKKNRLTLKYKSILYAFNIFPANTDIEQLRDNTTTADLLWNQEELLKIYNTKIKTQVISDQDSLEVFILIEDSSPKAYGFYLDGNGLWGSIESFVAINIGLDRMIGIDFTKQSETPGLGARITEKWFKRHFRNLDISQLLTSNDDGIEMVREKNELNLVESTNKVEAVTGATLTSQGVLDMLNSDLKKKILILKNNQKTLDAIAKIGVGNE